MNQKIAIIGGSNALIKDSYANILKTNIKSQVDIYAIGACSSILGIYYILSEKIANSYDFIFYELNVNDTHNLLYHTLSLETLVTYLFFICNSLAGSRSKLIFLILPSPWARDFHVAANIQKIVATFYRCQIIDFHIPLLKFQKSALMKPGEESHFNKIFQKLFAKEMLYVINKINSIPYRADYFNIPEFCLMNLKGFPQITRATALLQKNFSILNDSDVINIPNDKYLSGISYFNPENYQRLYFMNKMTSFAKDMKLIWNLFFVRSLGYFKDIGPGGTISLNSKAEEFFIENTYSGMHVPKGEECRSGKLEIEKIILCNKSPYGFGRKCLDLITKYVTLKNIIPASEIMDISEKLHEMLG